MPTEKGRQKQKVSGAALNKELAKITIHGNRDGRDIKKLGTVPENVNK